MRFVATVSFGKKIRSWKLFDKSHVWRGHRLQGKCKTGQSCVSTGGPFVWPLLAISTHLHWSIDPHYIPLLCTAPLNPFRDMALFFTQRRLKIALKSGQETVMASYVLCPPWWDTLLVWMYLEIRGAAKTHIVAIKTTARYVLLIFGSHFFSFHTWMKCIMKIFWFMWPKSKFLYWRGPYFHRCAM